LRGVRGLRPGEETLRNGLRKDVEKRLREKGLGKVRTLERNCGRSERGGEAGLAES
jgi:hypothetical protein